MKRENRNIGSRMTREALRRKKIPFYQKKTFLISIVLILIIAIGIFIFWRANTTNNTTHTTQPSHKIEKVKPKKKATKKSFQT